MNPRLHPRNRAVSPVAGQLPADVMVLIVERLDGETLKQIRFCSNWLATEAARHLFSTIDFKMRAGDLEWVTAIAKSSRIAHAVKKLVLYSSPRLVEFSFEDWCESSGLLCENFELEGDNEEYEPGFSECREQLYQEYESERNKPSLYECLHAPGPSLSESVLTTSIQNQDTSILGQISRFQNACVGFEKALLWLPNLQMLEVVVSDELDSFSWRGYYFKTASLGYAVQEVRAETASLAFILRALGKRNSSTNTLTSLSVSLIPASDYLGLQDLDRVWEPINERRTQIAASHIVAENRTLMENAFIHLKDVCTEFNQEEKDVPKFLEALVRHLSKAKNLNRLRLSRYDGGSTGFDMLTEINLCVPFSMLRSLTLDSFDFRKASILHTLSLVAPTLESLVLYSCTLLDEDSSWSDVYKEMRLIDFHALHHLSFRDCSQEQTPPQGIPDTPAHTGLAAVHST